MIRPLLSGKAFLDDVRAARADDTAFHLWWLGQSGFLVQWQGQRLLLDPYLSDSLTHKYASTDKPHVRMTERVVEPGQLDFIDVVTSSHNHTDHLDAETLIPILAANPGATLVIPEANRAFVAERLKIAPVRALGLDAGKSVAVGLFTIQGIPACHDVIEKDELGRCQFLGYIVRFGPWVVYHSGDTLHYEGMEEWLRPWNINVALLPINGAAPERRVAGNLDGPEAARLAHAIGARLAIPCHYEMFEFNTASPEAFTRAAEQLRQPYRVLRCGERWSSRELEQAIK